LEPQGLPTAHLHDRVAAPATTLNHEEPVKWDADAVRDDLRGYAAEAFAESDAVLAGMRREALRKGTVSAGVQHQYTGTAGRIENGQIACT
jgi:SRSO17 transposase